MTKMLKQYVEDLTQQSEPLRECFDVLLRNFRDLAKIAESNVVFPSISDVFQSPLEGLDPKE